MPWRLKMLSGISTVVTPTIDEFAAVPSDRRRAFVACLVTFHTVDYLTRPASPANMRRRLRIVSPEFALIDRVAHAFKHVSSDPQHSPRGRAFAMMKSDRGLLPGRGLRWRGDRGPATDGAQSRLTARTSLPPSGTQPCSFANGSTTKARPATFKCFSRSRSGRFAVCPAVIARRVRGCIGLVKPHPFAHRAPQSSACHSPKAFAVPARPA